MFTLFRKSFKALNVKSTPPVEASVTPALQASTPVQAVEFDIAPNDPLLAYFMSTAGLVEIDKLEMDSPALQWILRDWPLTVAPGLSFSGTPSVVIASDQFPTTSLEASYRGQDFTWLSIKT